MDTADTLPSETSTALTDDDRARLEQGAAALWAEIEAAEGAAALRRASTRCDIG